MKTSTQILLLFLCVSSCLCSCSLHNIAKAPPLEKGVKYEVRPAMDTASAYPPKKVENYYFMLDVPSHSEVAAPALNSLLGANLTVRTTAYCHSESDHIRYGTLTARGDHLKFGSLCSAAADWSRYPVGTRFRISTQPGVVYEVDDYGSALVGSGTIDLYRPTSGSMNAWGVREVDIEILQWGSFEDSLRLMRNRVQYPHVRQMIDSIERKTSQATTAKPESGEVRAFAMAEKIEDFRPTVRTELCVLDPVTPKTPAVDKLSNSLWMTPVITPLPGL